MLFSRLFWKIFLIYAVLSLVSVGLLLTLVTSRLRAVVEEQAEVQLITAALVLRQTFGEDFPRASSAALQENLRDLSAQIASRITIVADDGTVVGDSEAKPSEMDNHRERQELQLARLNPTGVGISRRSSATLEEPMLYAAVRVGTKESPVGFVRAAIALDMVNVRVSELEHRVATLTLALVFAAFVVTYLVASRIVGPLTVLTRATESVGIGDLRIKIPVRTNDDLSRLMTAFNGMVRELATRDEVLQLKHSALEEDSDRLSTVLGSMIEGVVAVDESQRVLFANKAAKSLLEFPGPDDVGRPIWEVIRNPTIQQVVNDALAGRDRVTVEFELPRKHSIVALLATRLPGKPCPGLVLVLHDVTELRRLENLRREFVSNVSHELKTPLTAIQAYTETLLSGALHEPEHSRQFVERIEEHADRLHALILDLLRLARIESSTDVFDVRAIQVSGVVNFCLEEHRPLAQARNISLMIEPSPEHLRVKADEEGLHTIISNLIDNAVKYTPADGRVGVSWRQENNMAAIEVSDTGPGIAPEHQLRIFERFYRVDKARSRELGGTGLGLSIVKHLTHVFGGTVEVRSQPGNGSTFIVKLPLA